MGNKSKRRQASVFIRDAEGYICGSEHRDIGYGRTQKNRCFRGRNTKTAVDREKMNQLRREHYRAKKAASSDLQASPYKRLHEDGGNPERGRLP